MVLRPAAAAWSAEHGIDLSRLVMLAVVIFASRGSVFPRLLFRASADGGCAARGRADRRLRGVDRVGAGDAGDCRSGWRRRVPAAAPRGLAAGAAVALSTILIGLFLIISRRTALMQVVGYLVLENGIYIFGVALAQEEPFLVEMGILLDVFVAVFVMGIAIFHISREFDHIDVDQLTSLKD